MRLPRVVPKTPAKSSVPPRSPTRNRRHLPTHSKSTLPQVLIPLHFNSFRLNAYAKSGGGALESAPKFCNSSPVPLGYSRSSRGFSRSTLLESALCKERTSVSFHGVCASFVFILLRTLLHAAKRYPQCFQLIPHSSPKTPGWGTCRPGDSALPNPAPDSISFCYHPSDSRSRS